MTSSIDWIATITFSELSENEPTLVHVLGVPVVVVRKDKGIYALSNTCAHMGCPLADGFLEGYFLKCSCHEWAFDIRTGELQQASEIRIRTYGAKTRDGTVWIRLQGEA